MFSKIKTVHRGYIGSQDTFYIGSLKRLGWVYQQTYVYRFFKFAHAKLYIAKTPITAADMLEDSNHSMTSNITKPGKTTANQRYV